MMKRRLQLFLLVVGVTAIAAATGAFVASASDTPGSVSTSRTLSTNDIVCDGTVDVTVTLDGTPGTAGAKADVLLVLDQSGSVSSALATSKGVANSIIDGIDLTRNKVGIVAFSGSALVTSAPANASDGGAALKVLVGTLPTTPPGTSGTNHADAFLKAQAALAALGADGANHVIVMITDGKTTKGNVGGVNDVTEANNAATAAKGAGTNIFTVRLGTSTSIDSRLKGWASDPDTTYFQAASPSPAATIVAAINPEKQTPAATNAKVVDTLNADFDFVAPASGWPTGVSVVGKTLTWHAGTIDGGDPDPALTYTVKHNKTVVGVATKKISASVEYTSDQQTTAIALSNPDVSVRPCGEIIEPPKPCGGTTSCTLDPDSSKLEGTGQADLAVDAGTPAGNSTLFLTKLSSTLIPTAACGGGFTNQFVQLDVLPLTDKLIVSVDLPARTSGPLLDLAKICLGTNLPFVTRSFGLARQESDGLYYGLLPYGQRLTRINGTWVRSPFISLVESRNIITVRGLERVTHVVFEVRSVGINGSDGRPGYDPRWGG